jgi:signal transduction histidine kinase
MSRRVRSHDWAATPLGAMDTWAPSLRTAVSLMLASGHAMQLAWGPQRIILYNDAYAPMLGERHPQALGIPFAHAWPEIWHEIEPLVEKVFAGETVRFEDMPLVMTRHGYEEDTWWNFSYSPVESDAGEVVGLLNVTVDASSKHRAAQAERELHESEVRNSFLLKLSDAIRSFDDANAIQETASRLLALHLGVNRALYSEIEGAAQREIEVDFDTRLIHVRGQYVADGMPFPSPVRYADFATPDVVHTFRTGGTLVVRDTERESMLEPATRSAWQATGIASLVAVSLVKHGVETAHFSVHSAVPRDWKPSEIELVREVAERTWAANERARAETALVDSAQAVRAALAKAEHAQAALRRDDEAKDRFLAVLSHELRNPLASVSAASQLLARPKLDEANRSKATAIIGRQTLAMKSLLDDLLDISRLRLGKMTLKREDVALGGIVDAGVEAARTLMESHRHTLTVNIQKGPMTVNGDPVRLAQVVANLLTNAAKYTPPGGRVALKAHASEGVAIVEVLDNGIGIEPSRMESMFEMFAQGDQGSGQAGQQGLGIGLALVRSILDLHDGRIHGESAGLGFGSRFVVTLPLVAGTEAGHAQAGSAAATVSAPPDAPHVLLVDDNTDVMWSVAALLEGCVTETADSGSQGLRLARQRMPDVAVLDLGLPDMSGIELGRALRALTGGKDVLLVAATGWGQESDREQTAAAGFDAHLVKPIQIDALQSLIDQHCRKPA